MFVCTRIFSLRVFLKRKPYYPCFIKKFIFSIKYFSTRWPPICLCRPFAIFVYVYGFAPRLLPSTRRRFKPSLPSPCRLSQPSPYIISCPPPIYLATHPPVNLAAHPIYLANQPPIYFAAHPHILSHPYPCTLLSHPSPFILSRPLKNT
jgi:hypothetical protein